MNISETLAGPMLKVTCSCTNWYRQECKNDFSAYPNKKSGLVLIFNLGLHFWYQQECKNDFSAYANKKSGLVLILNLGLNF